MPMEARRCRGMVFAFVITSMFVTAARAREPYFTGLGDLPGGEFLSGAADVSADGRVVIGDSYTGRLGHNHNYEAFRWTQDTGMVPLSGLPEDLRVSGAYGLSANTAAAVFVASRAAGKPA